MIRVLVCGGRDYDNAAQVNSWLAVLHTDHSISCIIQGGAPGADFLAGVFAEKNGIPVQIFPADWKKHGRAAGPIRNAMMLSDGKPDLVVAFPGGRGTADMTAKARAANIQVLEIAK